MLTFVNRCHDETRQVAARHLKHQLCRWKKAANKLHDFIDRLPLFNA